MVIGAVLELHYINIVGFNSALLKRVFYPHIDVIDNDFGYDILGIYNLADFIERCDNDKRFITELDKLVIKDNLIDVDADINNIAYCNMFINMLKKDCCLNSSYKSTRDIIVILDIE